jgi:hypothetical protein
MHRHQEQKAMEAAIVYAEIWGAMIRWAEAASGTCWEPVAHQQQHVVPQCPEATVAANAYKQDRLVDVDNQYIVISSSWTLKLQSPGMQLVSESRPVLHHVTCVDKNELHCYRYQRHS